MLTDEQKQRASKYITMTGNDAVDYATVQALENLRKLVVEGVANDVSKYCLPEALKTSLIWTINARSLRNFLTLRSSKRALWEMRELAAKVFAAIPDDHQFIFADCMEDA